MVAINAAVTHLNKDEMRRHVRAALRHGARPEEILEVFQLVSVLGIHAISIGFPAPKISPRRRVARPSCPVRRSMRTSPH